jgi:hypothetical protein
MVIFCRVRESFLLLSIHGSPAPVHQFYPTASCEVVSKQHGRSFEGANAPGRLGDGERRLALYDNPRFSPDRKSIAVTVTDPKSGADDIWVYPVAGGQPARITFGPEDEFAVWSPDGKEIAHMVTERWIACISLDTRRKGGGRWASAEDRRNSRIVGGSSAYSFLTCPNLCPSGPLRCCYSFASRSRHSSLLASCRRSRLASPHVDFPESS